jgi:malate dehydrogenase (oxaloacetate-decarboxylating)
MPAIKRVYAEKTNPEGLTGRPAEVIDGVDLFIGLSGARIMATGRSDYPNQINNVLAFPGVFRGALDVRAPAITEEMKVAAARAIAEVVAPDELREDYVIPSVFNRDVASAVADAVSSEARRTGDDRGGGTIGFAAIDAERLHAQG